MFLPPDLYAQIEGCMPIACVDFVPVRERSGTTAIGLTCGTRLTGTCGATSEGAYFAARPSSPLSVDTRSTQ